MSLFSLHVKYIVLALFLLSISAVQASPQESSPYAELESVGNKLFSRISSSQQEIKKFPEYMRVIIEEELMPSIDYKYAAYKILGKHLSKTSKEQRAAFVASIRHNLIRTYATALTQYKNQQVIFEPEKPTNGKRIVAVSTKIVDGNRPDIDIVFKMRQNKKTKQWKAFDMVVEGISLLSSKQAELNGRITKQGIEQVTLELASLSK
ncbi:MAG: ABC transporter substrate-binding protein [Colwellia sp.]|nr:ABC transporter substrate-binding protein [Colwellia sp.]